MLVARLIYHSFRKVESEPKLFYGHVSTRTETVWMANRAWIVSLLAREIVFHFCLSRSSEHVCQSILLGISNLLAVHGTLKCILINFYLLNCQLLNWNAVILTIWGCFCGQMLASASGPHGLSVSQICIWDLEQMVLKRTLTHHQFDIVCLAYARDDRFLISVGT